MPKHIYSICLTVCYSLTSQRDIFICFIWRSWNFLMLSLRIARDLMYWHLCTNIYVLYAWRWPNRSEDVCYFYKYELKNLNNYLDLIVSCLTKLTKCFYLIKVMVMRTSPYGQALDIEIARCDHPNYKVTLHLPLEYMHCNVIFVIIYIYIMA